MNQQTDELEQPNPEEPAKQQTSTVLEDDLSNLAREANGYHYEVNSLMHKVVLNACNAGWVLRRAKEQVGHGNFTLWLEENFMGSVETARVYMRIADNWSVISKELDRDPRLSLERALHILRIQKEKPKPFTNSPRDQFAIEALREQFARAIEEFSSDERIYLADSADLFRFMREIRARIERLAPVFAEALRRTDEEEAKLSKDEAWETTNQRNETRGMEILQAFRRTRDLTDYEKEKLWNVAEYSKGWRKGMSWLVRSFVPHEPEDPRGWADDGDRWPAYLRRAR